MNKKLQPYRTEIDEVDEKILDLLARRFQIVRDVGQLKTTENIKVIQSQRAENVITRMTKIAGEKNIPPALIHDFYTNIIKEAHKIEFAIKEQETENNATNNTKETKNRHA